jgi:plasmid stabilization system protein ParE
MARRKIIWSHKAKIKHLEILEFYYRRNQSKAYSQKIYREIKKSVALLKKQPRLGIKTDDGSVRALIVGDFIVFYEFTKTEIIIHTIWDSNQNPDDLRIK